MERPTDTPAFPHAPDEVGDAGWLQKIAARDTAAFRDLYDRYSSLIYTLSLRIVGDRRESEEVTQDVFVSLWQKPPVTAPATPLIPWLIATTRNKCVDRLRKAGRRIALSASSPSPAPEGVTAEDPYTSTSTRELSTQVRQCMSRLSAPQREVVEFAYFDCLTHTEISSRLDQPAGTVKSRIRLAMEQLRRCLGHLLR